MNSIYVSYGSIISKSDRNFNFARHEAFSYLEYDILHPELTTDLPNIYANDNIFPDNIEQTDTEDIIDGYATTRFHLIDQNKPNIFTFPPLFSPDSGNLKENSRLTSIYKKGA